MSFNCIALREIQDGELLAYLSNSIDVDVSTKQRIETHLARCPSCQEKALDLQQTNFLFSIMLYRQSCPDLDTLLLYQAGLLSNPLHQAMQSHLRTCSFCTNEVAELNSIKPTTNPSPSLKNSKLDQWLEKGHRLIKIPLTTSFPTLALRGQQQVPQIYLVASYEVTLVKIPPLVQSDEWEIQGQVIREDVPLAEFDGIAALWQDERLIQTENMDEFGFFIFKGIALGQYVLRISIRTEILTIEFSL